MPKPETRAWWDDVQYLRDSIERKREDEASRGLRLDARAAARAVAERAAGEVPAAEAHHDAPRRHTAEPEVAPRRTRRFERAGTERRGRFARAGRDGRQDEPRARAVTAAEPVRHEAPAPRAAHQRPLQ